MSLVRVIVTAFIDFLSSLFFYHLQASLSATGYFTELLSRKCFLLFFCLSLNALLQTKICLKILVFFPSFHLDVNFLHHHWMSSTSDTSRHLLFTVCVVTILIIMYYISTLCSIELLLFLFLCRGRGSHSQNSCICRICYRGGCEVGERFVSTYRLKYCQHFRSVSVPYCFTNALLLFMF